MDLAKLLFVYMPLTLRLSTAIAWFSLISFVVSLNSFNVDVAAKKHIDIYVRMVAYVKAIHS